jgi:hypothetical protein
MAITAVTRVEQFRLAIRADRKVRGDRAKSLRVHADRNLEFLSTFEHILENVNRLDM